ncbi:hypothetical protein FH972_003108 [Carpinus fangiana]|uniref:GIY-YIG domain-containing protein n=1 Tax=Carpinus fangiana TaxID=176857 RepID=A0A5N6QJL1_9ROSI|nr:hypothetical protein FH972_003108 [Carpinus fangiana]
MVTTDLSVAALRLKREDCKRTKHDFVFSKWQILVGPSDWEDYLLGKEGATRYRVQNLPKSSGPGLYELGIAVSRTGLGREISKLDPDRVIVTYLGQADNVKTRLQQYGRTGAHLGNRCFNGCPNDSKSVCLQKEPGLFEEIFSNGYPIVFRWVPKESKRDAEKTEAQLLNRFDYAWNSSNNGARRQYDILLKLKKDATNTIQFSNIVRKLMPFDQKQVGIRIKASTCADEESYKFLSGVFKFSRLQPRLVLDRSGVTEDNSSFCGVVLSDGSVCRRPPVARRKRCAEHKGMRITGFIPTLVTEGKSESTIGSDITNLDDREGYSHNDTAKCPLVVVKRPVSENFSPICGVFLSDGSACRRQPAQGRKRCNEHKDMRISGSIPESAMCKPGIMQPRASPEKFVVSKSCDTICGVNLGHELYCTRQPARGRVRCEEHKGLRLNGLVPMLAAEDKSHVSDKGLKFSSYNASTCGAALHDGSLCRRQPVEGNKRCWQHKGMRAGSSFSGLGSGITFLSCGVTLQNGSTCMRTPAYGRKRCEQHKGRRV